MSDEHQLVLGIIGKTSRGVPDLHLIDDFKIVDESHGSATEVAHEEM